ncbi:5-(carboxyamino)imidazole ribonucleotide synthase [Longimicrobium terrae]|uniref:N5-carboxyaminoimidazole ribonucleotide synthase n=1 Tax=Longimicrobium terrae TaxID=1639882 RepID=A0A841H6R3_9BACT|nr:5-(carboxyamino)imidazole ribonucleotide synthase [Longimicrobium terrae]MBB4639197.1 5-(carboxyamino)imidazole ribonucleotide synthase [Longimicrobium terrae]MBB6073399.1 5-(carboxyamino)imidazole ribonucleotide synthase [Longimicrobium terrae]NNC32613.1 5-(carboxyamino)imidazole ribonucleotide synthase [Longimicrobium terrae]
MTGRDATAPFLPGATIGMVGGGQLGRMFALEARRMGYRLIVLDPGEDTPAAQFCDGHIRAPFEDLNACLELARRSDLVTLEWENADVATLREMERIVPVRPGPAVLEVAQHRVREKDAARSLGVLTAEYRAVSTRAELDEALREVGAPAILKTARMGYDGKGQATLRDASDADAAWAALSAQGDEFILEARVPFRMEVSVICARSASGETACFPVAENEHRNGILHLTRCPARVPPAVAEQAIAVARTLAEGLGVIGLLAVEMFVDADGRILMNEIAPRPHNSGHHTLEACGVSQFEQQLRAVCGLPLGSPALLRPAAMVNLMGEDAGTGLGRPGAADALAVPETALHLYGKASARPGRKMGHLTSLGDDADAAAERALRAWTAMSDPR